MIAAAAHLCYKAEMNNCHVGMRLEEPRQVLGQNPLLERVTKHDAVSDKNSVRPFLPCSLVGSGLMNALTAVALLSGLNFLFFFCVSNIKCCPGPLCGIRGLVLV